MHSAGARRADLESIQVRTSVNEQLASPGYALRTRAQCRSGPLHDPQYLAQDALLAQLARLKDGSRVDEPFAWLVAVVRKLHLFRRRTAARRSELEAVDIASRPLRRSPTGPCLEDLADAVDRLLADVLPGSSEAEKQILVAVAAGPRPSSAVRACRVSSPAALEIQVKRNLENAQFRAASRKSVVAPAVSRRGVPRGRGDAAEVQVSATKDRA